MARKKVAIIGYGYVGKAFARMVENHYDLEIYDPYAPGLTNLASREAVNACDLAVICVPTPSLPEGGCDTSIVEESVAWIDGPPILIKSTVTPGTTDRLIEKYQKPIAMSPEYVGEGKYHVSPRMDFQTEMIKTPFVIIGGRPDARQYILDMLVPVCGPEKTYYQCTALEAEIIKYMENTYFAVKITFAQEMYEICKTFGADWYKVWQGWALDPRVDVMHTAVFPNARGFSGKCLPKDTNGLVRAALEHGYRPEFLMEMIRSNARFRPDEQPRFVDPEGNDNANK